MSLIEMPVTKKAHAQRSLASIRSWWREFLRFAASTVNFNSKPLIQSWGHFLSIKMKYSKTHKIHKNTSKCRNIWQNMYFNRNFKKILQFLKKLFYFPVCVGEWFFILFICFPSFDAKLWAKFIFLWTKHASLYSSLNMLQFEYLFYSFLLSGSESACFWSGIQKIADFV